MAYHHGNLRESLLQAGLQLLGERGPSGFTLREVARQAGVSHNAPYRHFANREELLAALATQGFEALRQAMLEAPEEMPERLQNIGLAYIRFALEHPHHYLAMFDLPLDPDAHPSCAQASQAAFQVLLETVLQNGGGDDLQTHALRAWSLVHGISKLAIAGCLPFATQLETLNFARQALK